MERIERFYKMEAMVQGGRIVTAQQFLETLEVSISTFKRDLEYLRDRMNVPIDWDPMERGYRLHVKPGAATYNLPGMWFNAEEAHALLTMQNLLGDLGSGLLGPHVQGLMSRIQQLMEDQTGAPVDVSKRVRVRKAAARKPRSDCFPVVG
ncbi:MAG: transcriptional regulator, partial [Burkholderiales bacterium]|nr:transcriptional regulator [Burkholderiales bacterium]